MTYFVPGAGGAPDTQQRDGLSLPPAGRAVLSLAMVWDTAESHGFTGGNPLRLADCAGR
ncbi:hypothetical protein MHZ93_08880 [Roseomonas sp. ACRSG]|nr:hypothetical protein [Roseomonas sp. ACRSG]